jgi:hypothetical protein
MRNTPCECAAAGWCQRHECLKSESMFHMCRRDRTAFAAWEEKRGPCLPVAMEQAGASGDSRPGLLAQAWNFGSAVLQHAATGFRTVDDETYENRLAACRECPSCDVQRMVCREPACGCQLKVKARWNSQGCPLGKWSATNAEP